ncbi:hypothetical protein BD779DRAFT_360018 [Infundibulicybe gibba]|nr:hypothetical protein BD779DRAFT_360018 [Infundibulicybe gibba]
MTNTRGGMSARGRGSGFINSSSNGGGGGRGGGGGGSAGPLRGHGSRGNYGGGNHGRRGGSFTSSGSGGGSGFSHQNSSSFRSRGQGHSGLNRGPRHDGGSSASFGARDGPMSSSFSSSGKKDENRRTLTDFKIIGLEIHDLSWTWGTFPSNPTVMNQAKEEADTLEAPQILVKDEAMEDEDVLKMGSSSEVEGALLPDTRNDDVISTAETAVPSIDVKAPHEVASAETRAHIDGNPNTPPPSRIRIYFHTPVTADDSRPIPHNSSSTFSFGLTPSDSRKGKRKKLEDDDGDIEEGRAPPPPPQMASGMGDDRSSVAASVAPSVAETASEADWLMAAIVEGEEAETEAELDPDREEQGDDDQLNVTQNVEQHEHHIPSNAESNENGERFF